MAEQDVELDKRSSSGFGHCESEYESVGEGDDDYNLSTSKDVSEKNENLTPENENFEVNKVFENLNEEINKKDEELGRLDSSQSSENNDNSKDNSQDKPSESMIKVKSESIQYENLNDDNKSDLNNLPNQKKESVDSKDDSNFNDLEKIDNQDQDQANKVKSDHSQLTPNLNQTDIISHLDEHLIEQKLENLSITSQLDKTKMLDNSVTKPEVIGLKMKENAGQRGEENKVLDSSNIEEEAHESNSEINDGDDEYEDVESEQSDSEKKESDENGSKEEYEEATDNADIIREEGDEQKSGDQSQQTLDDDEDRRNPQYIPKRGAFYEHDDRVVGEPDNPEEVKEEETQEKEKKVEKPKEVETKRSKKFASADSKWGHDLFNETDQKPKSRDEMISTYGYDIRNEDNPPKARRMRRYGRGPNKYTRNWKDSDAYTRRAEAPNFNPNRHKKSNRYEKEKSSRLERSVSKQHENSSKSANTKILSDKDFFELPSKNRESRKNGSNNLSVSDNHPHHHQYHQQQHHHHQQQQPVSTAWNKARSKPSTFNNKYKDDSRLGSTEHNSEYKTEPMKVIEAIEKNRRGLNIVSDSNLSKIEMVKTQTFENSRYSNRKLGSNNNFVHRNDANFSKYQNKIKPADLRGFNKELGRPITKNNHLAEGGGGGGGGGGIGYDISRNDNNRTRSNFERELKERNINSEDNLKDSRNSNEDNRTRNAHKDDNRNFIYHEESDVNSKGGSIDKIGKNSNELESLQQIRPKRYSSLRQHQQPRSLTDQSSLSTPVVTQFQPSTPHLSAAATNLNQRQTGSTNQYFEQISENQSPNYYHEPRSSPSTFAYISSTNIEPNPTQAAPHTARFLSQLAPRFISQSAPPSASQTAPSLPPVITATATTPYLSTYPPGYPQFPPPPPPPPTHYHSIQPHGPSPSAPEMYRGGVTYYDTAQQKVSPRQLPQRRPKNAIPIVPPPETGPAGLVDGHVGYLHEVVETEVTSNLEINT